MNEESNNDHPKRGKPSRPKDKILTTADLVEYWRSSQEHLEKPALECRTRKATGTQIARQEISCR